MKKNRRKKTSIFVSSTFRDMQTERDVLRDLALPRINEFAGQYGAQVEMIDLRWGVDTANTSEAEQNSKVLRTCLDEIERSRPFFLGLLGDRYGWVPPPNDMAAALDFMGFSIDMLNKSVTALEIEYGVLQAKTRPISRFYFRQSPDYSAISPQQQAIYQDDEKGQAMLARLKAEISEKMPELVSSYSPYFDNGELCGLEDFCEMVVQDICQALRVEWGEPPKETPAWQEQEEDILDAFCEQRLATFSGRQDAISYLRGFCLGNTAPRLLLLQGEPGSGKSGLLCKVMEAIEPECFLLRFACGISARSSHVDGMLRYFIHQLSAHLGAGVDADAYTSFAQLKDNFFSLLGQACQKGPVVAVVDALDQQFFSDEAKHMLWLTGNLPANFRLLASIIDGPQISAIQRLGGVIYPMPPISQTDAAEIISAIAASHHKQLTGTVVRHLCQKTNNSGQAAHHNPLYLSLMVQSLVMMDRYEHAIIDSYTASGMAPIDAIDRFMQEEIDKVPGDPEGVYLSVQQRIEKLIGGSFVQDVMGLLALSRYGLRESDLDATLRLLNKSYNPADFSWLRQMFSGHFAQGDALQWDFAHQSLRRAQWRYNKPLLMSLNQALLQHFVALLSTEPDAARRPVDSMAAREVMYHLHLAQQPQLAAQLLAEAGTGALCRAYGETLCAAHSQDIADGNGKDFLLEIVRATEDMPTETRVFVAEALRGVILDLLPDSTGIEYKISLLSEAISKMPQLEGEYLEVLGKCFSRLGVYCIQSARSDSAVQYLVDSVDILRDADALDALGLACGELAAYLARLERHEEAEEYIEEMLQVLEENHRQNRTTTDKRYLAQGYGNACRHYLEYGKLEEAQIASEKEMNLRQVIYRQSQDMNDLHNLARAYWNAGEVKAATGETNEAAEYSAKATDSAKRVYENTGTADSLYKYALFLANHAQNLAESGFLTKTQETAELALGYLGQLYEQAPNAEIMHNLALTHEVLDSSLSSMEKFDEAIAHAQKALHYYQKVYELSKIETDGAEAQRAKTAYTKHLMRVGRLDEAQHMLDEMLAYKNAAYQKRDTVADLRALMHANENLAQICAQAQRQQMARQLYMENTTLAAKVWAITGMLVDKWSEAVVYIQLSEFLAEISDPLAVPSMQNAINICKAMYDETGSEYHLARLAYANCLMGDVMCKMGQVAEAEEYYNANVEYCEISYGNEKDLDSLNSLVEALHKLAFYLDKHFSRGDALEAFKALLSTCQLLYKDHMDDPDYVEELFAICEKIRDHLPQYDKALPSRLEITQKAVEYGQFLVEANGDDARMLFRLAHCYYTLCEIAQLMTNWELFTENAQKALNTWNVCADKHMEQNDKNGANAVLGVAIQISQWMAKYSENLYGPWVAHFQKRMDALA